MVAHATERGLTAAFDASSLILLYKATRHRQSFWTDLAQLYRLAVSGEVWGEVSRTGYAGASFFAEQPEIFTVVDCTGEAGQGVPPQNSLGIGERSTMGLYLAGRADFIVIDDRRAAQFCLKEEIPFVNALLMPRLLCTAGYLGPAARQALSADLIRIGRYSEKIIGFVRQCPDERLHRFLPPEARPRQAAGRSFSLGRRGR